MLLYRDFTVDKFMHLNLYRTILWKEDSATHKADYRRLGSFIIEKVPLLREIFEL